MEILIKNARIPLQKERRVKNSDILALRGAREVKILELGSKLTNKDARVTDAKGAYALPAFVDLFADIFHGENKDAETLESGSLAARWGGFSDILVVDREGGDALDREIAKGGHCNIHRCYPIEKIFEHKGERAIYCHCEGHIDAKRLREAMLLAKKSNSLLILSPQPDPLYPNSCLSEGRAASLLKLPCEPASVEARCIADYIILAEETGCRVHLRGISCKKSVELVRDAKGRGAKLTASTSPPYFSFTDEDMLFIGSNAKLYPPLRCDEDRRAIIEALADNTLDCIDSGHTPRTAEEKGRDIIGAKYGCEGLQSLFCAAVTYLLIPGHIDILRLCELICHTPARILGLGERDIAPDCTGFNLVSLSEEFIFSENHLKGKSKNSPFINMSLCGNICENFT